MHVYQYANVRILVCVGERGANDFRFSKIKSLSTFDNEVETRRSAYRPTHTTSIAYVTRKKAPVLSAKTRMTLTR